MDHLLIVHKIQKCVIFTLITDPGVWYNDIALLQYQNVLKLEGEGCKIIIMSFVKTKLK